MKLALAVGFALMASAQVPDFTPPSPLLGAVLRNNTTEAKRLLAEGADPNQGRMIGSPAIFFPVLFRNDEPFRRWWGNGADVQARDGSGSTALMWAAFNEVGNPTLVEELPRLGADPNVKNQMGETALTWVLSSAIRGEE